MDLSVVDSRFSNGNIVCIIERTCNRAINISELLESSETQSMAFTCIYIIVILCCGKSQDYSSNNNDFQHSARINQSIQIHRRKFYSVLT
jgi:hypothetical protein